MATYFLKLAVLYSCAHFLVSADTVALLNSNIILTPQFSMTGTITELTWKLNENKVSELDGTEVKDFREFQGRTSIDSSTGALTIQNVTLEDAGNYKAELITKDGTISTWTVKLRVVAPVSKPNVTCNINNTVVQLHCKAEPATGLTYQWMYWKNGKDHQSEGDTLVLSDTARDLSVTCIVKNEKSNDSTILALQRCFNSGTDELRTHILIMIPFLIMGIFLIYYLIKYREKVLAFFRQVFPCLAGKNESPSGEEASPLRKEAEENLELSKTIGSDDNLPTGSDTNRNLDWSEARANEFPEDKTLKDSAGVEDLENKDEQAQDANEFPEDKTLKDSAGVEDLENKDEQAQDANEFPEDKTLKDSAVEDLENKDEQAQDANEFPEDKTLKDSAAS
ncbi:uncharacterized protein LOC102366853 isoform X3 [Latimeria chalumnae]|uniref:uncharacterized protein LOC102366853 isoform X3 n=1 Tax=Latimeria chalumnae TaxID=7897 RepID=UPI00313EA73B